VNYMTNLNPDFLAKFAHREYRQTFLRDNVVEWLRSQLIALREQRSLTQEAVAQLLGTSQSTIARYEKQDYGKWNVSTLLEYADAYDVALDARFVSWGTFIKRLQTQGDSEEVSSFDLTEVQQELRACDDNTVVSLSGSAPSFVTEPNIASGGVFPNYGFLAYYWPSANWAVPMSPLLLGNMPSIPVQPVAPIEANTPSSGALADAFWQGVEYGKRMVASHARNENKTLKTNSLLYQDFTRLSTMSSPALRHNPTLHSRWQNETSIVA
jgi:transcriptional regulator with XRE-family HTH domain